MRYLRPVLMTFVVGAFLAGCQSPCPQFLHNQQETKEYIERHSEAELNKDMKTDQEQL